MSLGFYKKRAVNSLSNCHLLRRIRCFAMTRSSLQLWHTFRVISWCSTFASCPYPVMFFTSHSHQFLVSTFHNFIFYDLLNMSVPVTSPMKQQFAVTHPYTVLQETERNWQILNRPTFNYVMFFTKIKEKQCFLWRQYFDRRCLCNPTV
jgi:hypothetical protein